MMVLRKIVTAITWFILGLTLVAGGGEAAVRLELATIGIPHELAGYTLMVSGLALCVGGIRKHPINVAFYAPFTAHMAVSLGYSITDNEVFVIYSFCLVIVLMDYIGEVIEHHRKESVWTRRP